jgi:hypothetical protein
MRSLHRWWPAVAVSALLVLALAGRFRAADKEDGAKNGSKKIRAVVKKIINRGADLFNKYGDVAGCYRFYQGGLIGIHGMLDDHPELQKAIDTALAQAEREPSVRQRAFVLRKALGAVWKKFGPKKGAKANGDKKKNGDKDKKENGDKDKKEKGDNNQDDGNNIESPPPKKDSRAPKDIYKDGVNKDEKKPAAKKDEAKKDKDVKKDDTASISGKVTFNGKPLTEGTITFTPVKKGKAVAAKINADGTYAAATIPPGEYQVTVTLTKPPVPAKYGKAETTPLKYTVAKGKNTADFDLKA